MTATRFPIDQPCTRRGFLAASAAAAMASRLHAEAPRAQASALGVVIHSFPAHVGDKGRRFSDPLAYLDHCRGLGAGGVQLSLGQRDEAYCGQVREAAAKAGMFVEASIALPRDARDVERFAGDVRTAQACGATVARSALLSGRRYETFDSAEAFAKFAAASWDSLTLAKPVVEREQLKIAVENHKDWRTDELLALLKRLNSPQFGVCIDTGNSMALVEEPLATVEALAPLAFSSHLKDMGVEEYPSGFRLAEVPFGLGLLDLPKVVGLLRKSNPAIRLNVEMITRDPLEIPVLTAKYWATMEQTPASELARMLTLVRKHAAREPLPRVAGLTVDERLRREDDNVRACLIYGREKL